MRVLQVVKTTRGATWAYNQAKWLHNHGVEIITVLPNNSEGYAEKYRSSGMKVTVADWSLPVSRPWKIINRVLQIQKMVHELNPDLIHLHFVTNVLMVRLALHYDKTPRVFQVPGPLHLENWFFNIVERAVATQVDYWAGACKKTCKIYKSKGVNPERVFLAYYGSPLKHSENEADLKGTALHDEYGFTQDNKLVGMVSYFYKPKIYMGQTRGLKGHEDFIDAMEIVFEKHPEAKAIIIGNAWDGAERYEQRVIEYAKRKLGNKVIFTGYRNDVKELYPELDIAVHPSHSENLGGAAESLAYGTPTIATNIGGFPDIVIDSETGLVASTKNPEQLAERICYMLENPEHARKMAEYGRILVTELLDIAQTAGHIKHVYESVLSCESHKK
jgi:glycosyltransferase involved in cell wall biosynthesis